jgi:hypothetical protein
MYQVVVVMPVYKRREQAVAAMRRLVHLSGNGGDQFYARFVAIGGTDERETLAEMATIPGVNALMGASERMTYWSALAAATQAEPVEALLVGVGSDVLPAVHYLQHVVHEYDRHGGDPIVGFNGDGYSPLPGRTQPHSAHFLISKRRLLQYGGWPVWYTHNFGDTELIERATDDRAYVKSPWAILFHDHPHIAGAHYDPTYDDGAEQFARDRMTYHERKRNLWR